MRLLRPFLLPACLVGLFFAADAPHRRSATPGNDPWLAVVQANLAHEEYFVSGDAPQAPNRAQGIRTYFTRRGLRVVPRQESREPWEGTLTLARYGSEDRLAAAAQAHESVRDNRFAYRRGALTEWYVNDEHGLEQGFTLAAAPSGNQHLEFDVAIGGTVEARLAEGGKEICFVDTHGTPVLRLGALHSADAKGRELASRFALSPGGHEFSIAVDATHAAYPVTVDPLLTSASWFKESNFAGASFGLSVATAGDVNGDGYSDLIVGAGNYDTGDPNGGQVTVYYGSATGPSTTPAWSAKDSGSNGFGDKVATAGDVNGDGFSDILVAAPLTNTDHGEVYGWYGSASGLGANGTTLNADWKVAGPLLGDQLGFSIACAGDVNKDGYADVVAGGPERDAGGGMHPGKALVYLGSSTGLSTTVFKEIDGTGNAFLGISVATAGDVNADGYSDIVIGAFAANGTAANSGVAYVYYGPSLTDAARTTLDAGIATAYFGLSVSTAGDVDGDGYSDVIIGSPGYDLPTTDAGAIYVYKGGPSGVATSYTWRFVGTAAGQRFGQSVSTAGDVNGDGYADIVAGWLTYSNGQTSEGAAVGYYGSSTGLKGSGVATSADWFVESNNANAQMGSSIGCAGDVNGDGFSDVIVGAPGYTNGQANEGAAYVFFGSPNALTTPAWQVNGTQANTQYGYAVASGDFNGDGYSDVAVSAPYYTNDMAYEGRVYVYNGFAGGVSFSPSWQVGGDHFKGYVGISLANAGDVNNDGYDDLLIGASGYSEGGLANEGHVFLFQGSATGLTGGPNATLAQANWVARGNVNNMQFGTSVAGAGDVNGDGYADVIVGTPFYSNGQSNEGGAFVYLGSASGLPPGATAASANWSAESNQAACLLGTSVASAGDVNGDGYSDIIVGAPQYSGTFSGEGAAFLWFGSAAGLGANGTPANADWSDLGTEALEDLGRSVNTAGDMNGDGYSDIVVGAPKQGATDNGTVRFFHGSATVPAFSSSYGLGVGDHTGQQVGPAGDVNGDGYADAVASVPGLTSPDTSEGAIAITYGGRTGTVTTTVQSNLAHAQMGSPSSAGDVNGDGFADLVVGLPALNTSTGAAWLYYGNGKPALLSHPRQRRKFSTTRIAYLGMADTYNGFGITQNPYSPFGRSIVRPEYEVKPRGQPFDGTGTQQIGVIDLATDPNAIVTAIISGLSAGQSYHWRYRERFDKARQPFQPAGRWITMPLRGANEADLRMLPPSVVSADQTVAGGVQFEGGTPNPFVGKTTFRFSLPYAMSVHLGIYDVRGRLVRELANSQRETAGWHTIAWDGLATTREKVADGAYFARLETTEGKQVQQVVLSR